MLRRLLILATVSALATLVVAGTTWAGSHGGPKHAAALAPTAAPVQAAAHAAFPGRTLRVVEHADTDAVVDLGATGDTVGDLLAFGNPIFDAANDHQIGRDEGWCVRTNPGLAWECSWSVLLDGGSITVQGPFNDDLSDTELAITGGTGSYRNARGEMTLHARNAQGTAFDFIYHLLG